MEFNTPILLIFFNRPDKTKKILEIIENLDAKNIFISADGPRDKFSEDRICCAKVKNLIEEFSKGKNVKVKINTYNQGLKKNIINSISWFFSNVEKGIIIEDDCIPSLSFFDFCQNLLNKYETNDQIMQINGTNLGVDYSGIIEESYFFSKLNHVWGWATWKRSWVHFDNEFKDYKYLKKNNSFNKYYVNNKITNWMVKYFDKSQSGKDNIWSINWAYSILKNNGLCITPSKNLVQNIGFDGSGTSVKDKTFIKFSKTDINEIGKIKHPKKINYNLKNDLLAYDRKISKIDPRANLMIKIKKKIINMLFKK